MQKKEVFHKIIAVKGGSRTPGRIPQVRFKGCQMFE
jgi:hypothetical protein